VNAQECTRVTQEALAAQEKNRVEVVVPRQIQSLSEEIARAASVGDERAFPNGRLHGETQDYFEGLGFYVTRNGGAVYWGESRLRERLREQGKARSKLTLWQRIFGVRP